MMDLWLVILLAVYLLGAVVTAAWIGSFRHWASRFDQILDCVYGACLWPLFIVLLTIDFFLGKED